MAEIVRFTARQLHLKPESRPRQIQLAFIQGTRVIDGKVQLEVEARDLDGRCITSRGLREMWNWLFMNRYAWLPGSNGVYVRG